MVDPTQTRAFVYTYTDNLEKKPKQDQEHPLKSKLNWLNPLNGVTGCSRFNLSYQFISLDGTRSAFEDSDSTGEWTDHIVPQGKQIRTVETLLDVNTGYLNGFKWIGDDGEVLLAVGNIDDTCYLEETGRFVVTTLTLNHNQRLVGVKSESAGYKYANHYSF